MPVTEWRTFDRTLVKDPYYFIGRKRPLRVRAEYDLRESDLGQTFDLRGRVQEKRRGKWDDISSGGLHEEIATHFKELEPYLKWDGMSYLGPTNYFTNAKYWWDRVLDPGKLRPDQGNAVDRFKWEIVFGALEGDELPPLDAPWGDVHGWLKERLPYLIEIFKKDMNKLLGPGLPEIIRKRSEGPREWYPDFPL